jgi:Uncharacterized alpha/beta hydrolase domain (DUF2235)
MIARFFIDIASAQLGHREFLERAIERFGDNVAKIPFITQSEKVTQIWFAGVHANVGGGYPDDSLAYIPLYWIWKEAKDCGLKFKASPDADPDAFLSAQSKEDKDGRLYDSRNGLAGYYRYGPRSVEDLCNSKTGDPRDEVTIVRPKIHETVFKRLSVGAHCYAPIGLPKAYDIVAYNPATKDHEIHSGDQLPETPEKAVARQQLQEKIVWSNVRHSEVRVLPPSRA